MPEEIEKLTLQRIFDLAWQAFIVEEQPPGVILLGPSCRYVCSYGGSIGQPCAVGLGLREVGAPLEARNFEAVFPRLVDEWPELFDDDICCKNGSLLAEFQDCLHDDLVNRWEGTWNRSLEERERCYRVVADSFNLTIPGET